MKILKKIFRVILLIVLICTLYLGVVIYYGTANDYQPEDKVQLEILGNGNNQVLEKDTFNILSWNIGFCGLGAEMDFFYDGGEMVHPTDELVKKYTEGVTGFLSANDSIDFIILQEVDKNSARTGKQNEIEIIAEVLPGLAYTYANNYNVKFVPVPFTNPLGKVQAGQMNLSKIQPIESIRYAFHSSYAWPKRLFMLDRCFILSRFNLGNGKQLVVLNTHNSAYDAGGELRDAEMPLIKEIMLDEYEKGNYMVAGGDWNQNPPGFNPGLVDKKYSVKVQEKIKEGFFPKGWNIVYDKFLPTNRDIETPFAEGETLTTIIDYYILSPNVEALKVNVIPQDFTFSDHEAVFLKFALK